MLVVIGNPPYNSFAGISPDEEEGLVDPYKAGLVRDWGVKKFNLDDLYVRFYRLAERQIAERSGRGVVCLISNASWLGDQSFVVMRKRLLSEFDAIWIDNLNGDSRATGKVTPDGAPDPSIFSTRHNREGIQVGTAIGLLVRRAAHSDGHADVRFREFWGTDKRSNLMESLADTATGPDHLTTEPVQETRFSLRPRTVSPGYLAWPSLADLWRQPPINGLLEKRRNALIEIDRDALNDRMRAYFDPDVTWESLSSLGTGLTQDAARFPAKGTRARVLSAESFDESRVRPYLFRPFDTRWAYYSAVRPLWNEPRPRLAGQAMQGTEFLLARVRAPRATDGFPFLFFAGLVDDHALHKDAYLIPIEFRPPASEPHGQVLDLGDASVESNTSPDASAYLSRAEVSSRDLWMHVLAVGYSSRYCDENAAGIQNDWPRIPLPQATELLSASASLGRTVTELLSGSSPPPAAPIRLGTLSAAVGEGLNPDADLSLSAHWGIAGRDGICMPSTGKLGERAYTAAERVAIAEHAESLGMSAEQAIALLGETCFDVYLNDVAYWRCVPANVWRYTIGGYQVIKKWLSYRERALLGRDLKPEEARYVTEMVRRIAALVLMQPELDANYERVKADVYDWSVPNAGRRG